MEFPARPLDKFIALKERCKLQNALRVKMIFNSLKGEFWVAGMVKLLNFKIYVLNFH